MVRAISISILFIALLFSFNSFSFASTNTQSIIDSITEQQEIVENISQDIFTKGQINSLSKKLEHAKAALLRDKHCTAANIMNAYINETNALSNRNLENSQFLNANGRMILYAIIEDLPDGEKCKSYERYKRKADLSVDLSNNQDLSGSISFGAPEMIPTEGNGEAFIQLKVPGIQDHVGDPGKPGVPYIHKIVAVPRGADVFVSVINVEIAEKINLHLYPYQYPKIGFEEFEPTESNFVIDEEAYASRELFPSEICSISVVGQFRDLPIAMLSCAAGQYDAANNELYMFDKVDLRIDFSEGENNFITDGSLNPFESYIDYITPALANGADVKDYVESRLANEQCKGEELLIFTPEHLKQEADRLAAWKANRGISSRVEVVFNGTTAKQIDDYIEQRFDECIVRPSYVLLFGDAEYVPTFYVTTNFDNDDSTASDYPYAVLDSIVLSGPNICPSLAVGRIPIDTVDEAKIVVDKIISYEGTPPEDESFYKNISIVSEFECCRLRKETVPLICGGMPCIDYPQPDLSDGWANRANIQTSEFVRNGLLNENYTVERIYAEKVNYLISNFPVDPEFDTTPRRYYSGADLPPDIGPLSGFAWNGMTLDITTAFNRGRFLLLKRGHGSWYGWKNPQLMLDPGSDRPLGDLWWLANFNRLPVVFGMACELAFFDNETNLGIPFYPKTKLGPSWDGSREYPNDPNEVYFSEQLIRMEDAGVIGLIGATRMSPGTPNNALTRGLFDAIWPDIDPAKNTNEKSIRRLGDILNSGKIYMLGQIGIPQPKDDPDYPKFAIDNLYLYNLIGDPTLAIWTSKPFYLPMKHKKFFTANSLIVEYEINGARMTALQEKDGDTVPIGRATVKDENAIIEYITEPDPNLPFLLSVRMQDAIGRPLQLAMVDLENEDAFSSNATRITFEEDDRYLNEHINTQYEELGVIFLDDESTTPLIINDTQRQGITYSPHFSLANDADTINPGSAGVPLTITFVNAVQRAGMYIGNGQGTTVATLTAYDGGGNSLFTVNRTGFGNDVTTFIGIDAGTPIIKKLKLDYGLTSLFEEIDDLMFE